MHLNQPKKDYTFDILYFITAIAFIILSGFPQIHSYFIWLKPIPILFLVMKLHTVKSIHTSIKFIEIGLLFGMIGDMFVEVKGNLFFQIGVFSFFIGHIFYIIGYLKAVKILKVENQAKYALLSALIYFFLIAGATMTNLHYVWKYLDLTQKIGFSIYSCFLSLMSVTALYLGMKSRNDQNMKFVGFLIYFGSLLFWMSDNILAEQHQNISIDKDFKRLMGYTVGITYWLGQYLICSGAFKISQIQNLNIQELSNTQNNKQSNKQNIKIQQTRSIQTNESLRIQSNQNIQSPLIQK